MRVLAFTAESLTRTLDELELAGRTTECRSLAEAILPQIDASNPVLLAALHLKIGRMAWIDPQDGEGGDYEYAISHLTEVQKLLEASDLAGNSEIQFISALADLNLGGALTERLNGVREENIEDSIQAFSRALIYLKKEIHPIHYATAHHNIGRSYYLRKKESRKENLEKAIEHLKKAAQARDRENQPIPWSRTQMNLGIAYTDRICGEPVNNVESALEHFEHATFGFCEPDSVKHTALDRVDIIRRLLRLAEQCPQRLGGRLVALAERLGHATNYMEDPTASARAHRSLAGIFYELRHLDPIALLNKAGQHYERAIALVSRDTDKVQWAQLFHSLGNVCWQLPSDEINWGPRRAIELFKEAEAVLTKDQYPLEWARIQVSKGSAYRADKSGDHAERFGAAILAFERAAEVLTHESKWEELASLQVDLANAYVDSNVGSLGKNIQQAIDLYQQALKTLEEAPIENPRSRAVTQGIASAALGMAYARREVGDPSQNFAIGERHLNDALSVFSRETAPRLWAGAHMNFGNLSTGLPRRELRQRLSATLEHFRNAHSVFTRDKYPYEWATCNFNLCVVARAVGQPDEVGTVADAINMLKGSLDVFERESAPRDWAMVHREMMLWYAMDRRTEAKEMLRRISDSARKALQVYRKDKYIFDWALVHLALGGILSEFSGALFKRSKAAALRHFINAETVFTRDLHPNTYVQIQAMKGTLHLGENRYLDAEEAFAASIDAATSHLGESYSHAGRDHLITSSAHLYSHSAYCRLMLGDYGGALTRLEQGKARHLSEVLIRHAADLTELAPDERGAVTDALMDLQMLEADVYQYTASGGSQGGVVVVERLGDARRRFREVLETIRHKHPGFMPEVLKGEDLLGLVPRDGVLAIPFIHANGTNVFIFRGGDREISDTNIVHIPQFDISRLTKLFLGEGDASGWLHKVANEVRSLLSTNLIDEMGRILWSEFFDPVHRHLSTFGLRIGAPLVILPHAGLNLLPLQAAWRLENGGRRYIVDDYTVSYAPSGRALATSRQKISSGTEYRQNCLAVINPTSDLRFTILEGESLASRVKGEARVLSDGSRYESATLDQVVKYAPNFGYLHFACHGKYGWGEPLSSRLYLAGGSALTALDVISRLTLDRTRLVCMSACETGIFDVAEAPDEFIGLQTAFLRAGAPGVLGTLWVVEDLSTMLLVDRLYENQFSRELGPAQALREAQLWLRGLSRADLLERSELYGSEVQSIIRSGLSRSDDPLLFSHPYFWAALTMWGE